MQLGPKGIRTILATAVILTIAGSVSASRVQFDLDPFCASNREMPNLFIGKKSW